MTAVNEKPIAKRPLDAETCYQLLLDLYWAIKDWSTFFAGENPQDRNQNIMLVRQKSGEIIILAELVGSKAKACLDELEDTVHIDEVRRALNRSDTWQQVPKELRPRWHTISAMERASRLGWMVLSERGIKYLAHSDDALSWDRIRQQDIVSDIQKACRNGLEQAGSVLGKTETDVRKEMACPPAKAATNEPTGEKRPAQSPTIQSRAIPPEKRTKSMTKLEALNFIGWPPHAQDERQARDWFTKSIDDGEYRREGLNNKKGVYHLDDFPEECWPKIRRSG